MKNRILSIYIIILLLPAAFPCRAFAQEHNTLSIHMNKITVSNDSLRIDGRLRLPETRIASTEKLIFALSLEYEGQQLALPTIVVGGKRRLRYEQREQTVDPGLLPEVPPAVTLPANWKKAETIDIHYRTSLPYASWMQHAGLRLEQWIADCCRETRIASDLLSKDIDLDYACAPAAGQQPMPALSTRTIYRTDTVYLPQIPAEVPLCYECTVIYVDFPQGSFRVKPAFKTNRRELLKVDSLMQRLPVDPFTLSVTSYASPEGTTGANDLLAYQRMKGFTDYIRGEWILPANGRLSSTSRGEDWDGLVTLLRRTRKSYAPEVTAIIEKEKNISLRKQRLAELDNGRVWNDMLADLFPLLRRIELKIVQE